MKRSARFLLNVGGPAFFAALFLTLAGIISSFFQPAYLRNYSTLFGCFFLFLIYGEIFAAIPSLLHAWLMERVYRRFPDHTWIAVASSSLSGLGAGLLIALLMTAIAPGHTSYPLQILSLLGALVGFFLGLAIRFLSRRANRHSFSK